MTEPANPSPAFPSTVGSERFRLARLAHDAALRVPGVADTDTGPMGRFVTVGGGERLDGVTCVAAEGGFDVSLRLVCELVPLPELLTNVKAAVQRAALAAGIPVADLNVFVADVVEPGRA